MKTTCANDGVQRRPIAVALVALFLATACGPIGPLAGGKLRGEPGSRSDLGATAGETTAQLETNPSDPHSVNTWFAVVGSELYVPTSMIRGPKDPTERTWVANVKQDPRVRIRIDGRIHERVAKRLADDGEYDRARAALEKKYELDPAERDPERQIWIYRLDSR